MKKKERIIPIFALEYESELREQFSLGCQRILDEAYLSNHTFVRKFEDDFAEFQSAPHALAVSNGTQALEVILRALEVEGREVLIPTNTFIATHIAILNAGGIPRLFDLAQDLISPDLDSLARDVSTRTKAMIIVHIGGIVSEGILRIAEFCKANGIHLIEDCAHAFGSSQQGIQAGNFGVASAFSFFTTKVMTTGEGGMVVTKDKILHQRMKSIRQFGMDPDFPISHVRQGSNFKMNEFSALLGVLELKRVRKRMAKRQQLARRYQDNLKGSSWSPLVPGEDGESSYYKQVVLPPLPRSKVEEHFRERGIALTGGVYYIPLHRQPVYGHLYQQGLSRFPNADSFCSRHICPPCYPELDLDDIDYITETMLELR